MILIASVLALPVAWWGLSKWLQDFSYRISIPWIAFILAPAMAVMVAMITVAIQAIRVALVNPVRSLRTE
jgi:putative ABC transport system permease protein